MASRGAAPESRADDVHYPGTYAAGLFNRLAEELSGRVIDNESIVDLPDWLPLTFRIEGGPWFHIDHVELLEHSQRLDLHQGVLVRRLRFRDERGRTTSVAQRRIVSMRDPHVAPLETTILPQDWTGRLEVQSAIDGGVRNWLVPRYRTLAGDHLELVAASHLGDGRVVVQARTNTSGVEVAMAARTTVHRDGQDVLPESHEVREGPCTGHELAVGAVQGEPITVDKAVTVFTGRDPAIESPSGHAARALDRLGRFSDLLEEHVVAWRHLWERCHFEIDGHEADLQILRLHLRQTLSPHTAHIDAGVPPGACTGRHIAATSSGTRSSSCLCCPCGSPR
jgi:trehalose/maltose hydrolase-like predicted phosphorylase